MFLHWKKSITLIIFVFLDLFMNKKILIYILVTIVLLGVIYLLFFRKTSNNIVPVPVGVIENQTPIKPIDIVTDKTLTTIPEGNIVSSKNYSISIINFSFDQSTLNINKGDTVTWTNNDDAPHQISGNNLNSLVLNKGQTFSHTFTEIGTTDYHCSIHPFMTGTIIVK